MKKFLALLMVLTLVLSFAACGGSTNEETTTEEATTDFFNSDPTTEVPEETTIADVTDPSATEAPTEAPTEATTADGGEVTTAAGENDTTAEPVETTTTTAEEAPVGSDIAKIVAYYNNVANATKGYKGKFKIVKDEQKKAEITEFSVGFLKSLANDLLQKGMGDPRHKEDTFNNGTGKGANGNDLKNFIPLDGEMVMSRLTANAVKSAQCVKSGDTYKIKIVLKPETVGCNQKPANHIKAMGMLEVTDKDVSPFVLDKEKTSFTYTGATIEAVVGENGLLSYAHFFNPVTIKGTLKKGVSVDATVKGSWEQKDYFTYY
ncbi:MAG: hypothetical protein K5756_06515 [Clostridiales bacterium]|nr:hypothetical protein [Clostridiales bacterium]